MKTSILKLMILVTFLTGCTSCDAKEGQSIDPPTANDLGAMSPEDALAYMKVTSNLIIVDVASVSNYDRIHFEGALNISIENISVTEADKLYKELPEGKPVILHCRRGMIVPGAYHRLKELRPDIPEISYIAGVPPFEEYNQWYNSNK